jgi:hypothetical protein
MKKCLLQTNLQQAMWEVYFQGLSQEVLEIAQNFSKKLLS